MSAAGTAPAEDQGVVIGAEAAEDISAEPSRADRRGDRGRSDRDHRRRAHAGGDHAERERELDLGEELPVRHSEAAPRLADARRRRR